MSWEEIRLIRNLCLEDNDWWALKDVVLSAEKKAFRQFLRDLPSNFELANDAADAWAAYDIPE